MDTTTATITWTEDGIGRWTLATGDFAARIVRDRSQTTGAALFPWNVSRDGDHVASGVSCSLAYARRDAERAITAVTR